MPNSAAIEPDPPTPQSPAETPPSALDRFWFDEYKFFASSTERLSERRQAATRTYLTVNTAIVAAVTFFIQHAQLGGWQLALTGFPVFCIGTAACWTWERIIAQYKALIKWRYDQLMAMEQRISPSHHMYIKEADLFFEPKPQKKPFGFSRLEVNLPRMFLGLYLIYAVVLASAAMASSAASGTSP